MSSSTIPVMPVFQKKFEKCRSSLRWLVLLLGCLMMVGSYYSCDIPAAIKTQLSEHMGNPVDYELKFGLLFTLYAGPNVVLPILGGYTVDSLGTHWSLLTYSSIITLGQTVFSIGLATKSWPIIFLGRFIFGLGGECFMVANTALLSDWFKGRELAFAFGVNLAFSRLGSVFNNIISPIVARRSIIFASWLGALLCAAGVVCVLMTIPIDRFTESQMQENTKYINVSLDQDDLVPLPVIPTESEYHVEMVTLEDAGMENSHPSPKENVGADQNVQWTSMFSFSMVFWILVLSCMTVYGCLLPFNNISSSLLLERDYFRVVPPSCRLQNPQACQSADNLPVFCPASVWYQLPLPANVTMNGITYSPLQPEDVDCSDDAWQSGCTKDYCARKLGAYSQASYVMSIPYLVSAVLSPPIGYWVDLFGMRAMIALVSPLMLILVHMTIAFTHVSPLLPLLGQGLACSGFVAVLWPCVPLVVKEEVTGLAFGIVASMQNLAAAVVPLIVAAVFEASDEKYIPNVELLFVFLAIIGSCVGFCLNHYDSYYGNHVLNSPCLVSCETR